MTGCLVEQATPGFWSDVEQNCTKGGGGKREMVDAEAIAKSTVEKVRRRQRRNGVERRRDKAATEA
jgi:hypothetical protein